jgi:alanyl-tRNA synthetase
MKTVYLSKGKVLGVCWGGGRAAYGTISLSSEISQIDLINKNLEALENGSLDSGMGFERLLGALLTIETIREIEFEDRIYCNVETEEQLIGDLTGDDEDFLFSIDY